MRKSSDALGRKFLSREAETAAHAGASGYAKVLAEVNAVKGDVAGLHGALGALGTQVRSSRRTGIRLPATATSGLATRPRNCAAADFNLRARSIALRRCAGGRRAPCCRAICGLGQR